MSKKSILRGLAILGALALLGATGVAAASPAAGGRAAPAAEVPVTSKISYQGRLTDPAGNPLNGSYTLKFELYTAASAGVKLWEETQSGVAVQNGLFTVQLNVDPLDFQGSDLWLAISVNGQALSPRQEILPAPYAFSLRPGAVIRSFDDMFPLAVVNHAAGYGFMAWGEGNIGVLGVGSSSYVPPAGHHGVYGIGDASGVTGQSPAIGVRGLGPTGVYGESSAEYGQGVSGHGTGAYTEGVLGTASGAHAAAVYGIASGSGLDTQGVLGQSTNGDGVEGLTDAAEKSGVYGHSGAGFGVTGISSTKTGVQGFGPTGVYGESDTTYGQAVQGHGTGGFTEGILGTSDQNVGVYGISGSLTGNNFGVWGQTAGTYGLYTGESLYVGGSCTGCTVAYLGKNDSDVAFENGTVVAITGIAAPLKGQSTPVLLVQPYTQGGSSALGVVQTRMVIESSFERLASGAVDQSTPIEISAAASGSVAPGEYLLLVVQGLTQVRVDAGEAPVRAGDMLYPGSEAPAAQPLVASPEGVPPIGRALEPAQGGGGLIWVLVLGR